MAAAERAVVTVVGASCFTCSPACSCCLHFECCQQRQQLFVVVAATDGVRVSTAWLVKRGFENFSVRVKHHLVQQLVFLQAGDQQPMHVLTHGRARLLLTGTDRAAAAARQALLLAVGKA